KKDGSGDLLKNFLGSLPKILNLAEANLIQKSDKFTVLVGLCFASFSPLNLDKTFAEISMQKDLPEYLKDIKIQDIPIVGRQIKELQYDIEKF
ncbi:MAG: hypothetical protein JRF40_13325, partial [Deltaproteobacteria bacterium]|nr:hypothetical protein [Deltaproteobacteria bacterium]